MALRRAASWLVSLRVSTVEAGSVWRWRGRWVSRTVTCVGGRSGGDWRRSLRDLGGAVGGGMRLVVVRVLVRARLLVAELVTMLEELEVAEVVAVRVHRNLGGGAEAAVVEGLALLGEVSQVALVELALCCGLTTLSSDSRARPPSTSRYFPGANGMVLFHSCFEGDLDADLPLAERFSRGLELDLPAAAPVAHARTLLHAPWLPLIVSQVL